MGIFGGSEPQLLADGAIFMKMREIIVEAQEYLTIVSPYVRPADDFVRQLERASMERKVEVTLLFRKDALPKYLGTDWLTSLAEARVRLGVVDRLHSKIYANERAALVTSMNFSSFSGENSFEAGVFFDSKHSMTDALLKYLDELEGHAEEVVLGATSGGKKPKPGARIAVAAKSDHGYCIRCGTDIALDEDAPYCAKDYRKWAEYENPDYVDKFCHRCGKPHGATKRKPLCGECYSKSA